MNPFMRASSSWLWVASVVAMLVVVGGAGAVRNAAAQTPPAARNNFPGTEILGVNFDVRELNRPELEEMSDLLRHMGVVSVYSNRAPERLQPILEATGVNLPEFMEPVLAAGGAPEGDRYMRLRFGGGNALLTSKESLVLTPGARVRFSALARWADLGSGHWEALLRLPDGKVVSLFVGRGELPAWQTVTGESVVPMGYTRGWLEVWVHGYGGPREGEFGLDNLLVETVPRVGVAWKDTSRRIESAEKQPLDLKSFGLPAYDDPYQLHIEILDRFEQPVHVEDKQLLVNEQYPIDYSPRFSWKSMALPRGIYHLVMTLKSPKGNELTERRTFALAGTPIFRREPGAVEWGVELLDHAERPEWFDAVAPQRVLVALSPAIADQKQDPKGRLPEWLLKEKKTTVNGLLSQPHRWMPDAAAQLQPLLETVLAWYWTGDVADGLRFFQALRQQAPYLVVGQQLPVGVTAAPAMTDPKQDPGQALITPTPSGNANVTAAEALRVLQGARGSYVSRIELRDDAPGGTAPPRATVADPSDRDPHARLGRLLYAHAAAQPRAVFVKEFEGLFQERLFDGGTVPTRSLLTWEFVVGFLSGADFVSEELWDPQGVCLVFRRDGQEYLAIFTDGAEHTVELFAGRGARAYNSLGSEVALTTTGSKVTLPVSRDPLLVAGLDLARVRTRRSLTAVSEGLIRNTEKQAVRVRLKNYFPDVVRASFDLQLPKDWELEAPVDSRRIDPDAQQEWVLAMHVPPVAGVDGAAYLDGTLRLERTSGEQIELPIHTPIPVESKLVQIRSIGLGAEDADVAIKNLTDKPIRANVYLAVEPEGRDVVRTAEILPPGVERTYQIRYGVADGVTRQLLVSVVIPAQRAYANRVFDLP